MKKMNHIFRRSIDREKEKKRSDGRKAARANLSIAAVVSVLVISLTTAMLATAAEPPAPFHVYGWVKYSNGTAVLNPNMNITNHNTSENYNVETNASSNYYQVITSSCNVSAGDVLYFNASDNGNSTNCTVTVTSQNMTDGGLFEQNLTIPVAVEQPDLVISDVWVCWPDNCTICYNITNIGNGTAPAGHNTTLYVDGNVKANDTVPIALASDASYIGCFNYTWTYTPTEDNITVCADNNKVIGESDEDNNCWTEIWMCGDVNKDKTVDMIDVLDTYDYFMYNVGQLHKWAADVNRDCTIDMIDVLDIYDHFMYGKTLNCWCKV